MNSTDMQIMLDEMSRIINEMVNKNLYKYEHFTKNIYYQIILDV